MTATDLRTSTPTSAERNKQRMQAIYAALETGDGRPFVEAMADDFSWEIPGRAAWSRRWSGKRAVREQLFQPLFAQFVGTYTSRAIRYVAEGDIVVVESRGRVDTVRGEAYDNTYCCVCRFGDDGLLHELTEYMDTGLADAVLVPPPPSPPLSPLLSSPHAHPELPPNLPAQA